MKKYVAKWKRKKIVLTQDDYKILLERFDLNNFETIHNRFINRIPCPLCKDDKHNECRGCPFDLYRKEVGCIKIITEVLKEINQKLFKNMFIDRNSVWLPNNVEEGKRSVAFIRELLITRFKLMEE